MNSTLVSEKVEANARRAAREGGPSMFNPGVPATFDEPIAIEVRHESCEDAVLLSVHGRSDRSLTITVTQENALVYHFRGDQCTPRFAVASGEVVVITVRNESFVVACGLYEVSTAYPLLCKASSNLQMRQVPAPTDLDAMEVAQ